jgi:hypothetical protein
MEGEYIDAGKETINDKMYTFHMGISNDFLVFFKVFLSLMTTPIYITRQTFANYPFSSQALILTKRV